VIVLQKQRSAEMLDMARLQVIVLQKQRSAEMLDMQQQTRAAVDSIVQHYQVPAHPHASCS